MKLRDEMDEMVIESLQRHSHFLPPEVRLHPRFVLDLGCWIGYTTRMFARKWPRAVVVACDADAENAALAIQNCSAFRRVHVFHATLGQPGKGVLTGSHKHQRSLKGNGWNEVATDVVSVDQFLDSTPFSGTQIDFCKMDVEGAESACLQGEWMERLLSIKVDIHSPSSDDIVSRLEESGFSVTPESVGEGTVYESLWAVRRSR